MSHLTLYMYTVYKISNDVNDKVYVGHTGQPLKARWSCHKSYAKHGYGRSELYENMRDIGIERFRCEPIAHCDDVISARNIEEHHMEQLGGIDSGYNHNKPTHKLSPEVAEARSRITELKATLYALAIVAVWKAITL